MMIFHAWTMTRQEEVKPSTHIKFGEASAVLAGNSLLTLAFEIILTKITTLTQNIK